MKETTEYIVELRYGMEIGYRERITRCKDCKYGKKSIKPYDDYWCEQHEKYKTPNWFCADGKPKDNER